MAKQFFVIATCSALLFLLCCKKDNSQSPSPGPPVNLDSVIIPWYASNCYAQLFSTVSYTVSGGALSVPSFSANAVFYKNPQPYTQLVDSGILVNAVMLDTITFSSYSTINNGFIYQGSSTGYISFVPVTWKVQGLGSIPSFTYSNTSTPSYTGYASLPDTIDRNQPLNLVISGITGFNYAQVTITDYHKGITKVLTASTTTLTFSPGELSVLNPDPQSRISVLAYKNNFRNVYAKPMLFFGSYYLHKPVIFK